MATQLDITVAIVPREKFSTTKIALDSLLENTTMPFKLLYVDAGSPPKIRDWLRQRLTGRPNTELLRYNYYMSPFQLANIVSPLITTKYLVLADNDIYFQPGWLESLYECAEQTQADAVAPVITIGGPQSRIIHVAGGELEVRTSERGGQIMHRHQNWEDYHLDDVADKLKRSSTQLIENHCTLIRTEVMRSFGPLDEAMGHMVSTQEWSMQMQKAGAKMVFEPKSHVVYLWGEEVPLKWMDIPYWYMIWGEKWNRRQLRHLLIKYGATENVTSHSQTFWWMGYHRRLPLFGLMRANRTLFNKLHLPKVGGVLEKVLDKCEVGFSVVLVELLLRRKNAYKMRAATDVNENWSPEIVPTTTTELPVLSATLDKRVVR